VLVTNGQLVQFMFSFAVSIPLVSTHYELLNKGEAGCAGFNAWCFNAVFNGTLLARASTRPLIGPT
jgi:hypothetical protein